MFEYPVRRPQAAVLTPDEAESGSLRAPALYRRLCRIFGRVRVGNRGEPFLWRPVLGPRGSRARMDSTGEVYRFNCPYCGDRRGRGWVSHYLGQPDPVTGRPLLELMGCFNEPACFDGIEPKRELLGRILGMGGDYPLPRCEPGEVVFRRGPVSLPGTTILLRYLTDDDPPRVYLRDRGFDPDLLQERYLLGYCLEAEGDEVYAAGRLIVGLQMDGKLVGWQARRLRERDSSPKYFSSRGGRGGVLYGHDDAIGGKLVVLVEGAAGVWALGPPAMATLGDNLSRAQVDRLAPIAERGGLAAVLYDPGAEPSATKAAELLEPLFGERVVVIRLPDTVPAAALRRPDPPKLDIGELRRDAGRDLIRRAIAAAGWQPEAFDFGVDDEDAGQ